LTQAADSASARAWPKMHTINGYINRSLPGMFTSALQSSRFSEFKPGFSFPGLRQFSIPVESPLNSGLCGQKMKTCQCIQNSQPDFPFLHFSFKYEWAIKDEQIFKESLKCERNIQR
jgi:hypothetical protein